MKLPRRRFLNLAGGAAALPAVSRIARAQSYPSRTVRIVVGFPAGQAIDISARLMAEWLQQRLGQSFIVENRPGAAANVATEMVARSPADGYTLLIISSNNVINTTLYGTVDFAREIAPIATFGRGYQVLNVNNSLPVKTVPELIAFAKAHPGKLNMASPGIGSAGHVAGEMFKMMTGMNMVHVPYRGSVPALTDLMSGQVQVMFDNLPSSIEHIRASRICALAVTPAARSQALSDVPTIGTPMMSEAQLCPSSTTRAARAVKAIAPNLPIVCPTRHSRPLRASGPMPSSSAFGHEPMGCCFCAAAPRPRLDRGPHRRDRVSLGGGTQLARRRDRG